MNQLDGVSGNPSLVTIINDLHGKEVMVELKDGNKFVGIFAACSNELSIGLKFAYEKNESNEMNLLPNKKEIKEKMIFEYGDIVVISALINEEKKIKGFATDRDYQVKNNGKNDDEELKEWDDDEAEDYDPAGPALEQRSRFPRNGWSVNDMFTANSKLGVQSSFEDDLRQYTTAEIEGTPEDRVRAEQIAREIENSAASKYYSRLENDDEERDLDKLTTEEELDNSTRRGRGSYTNVSRNGRGGNVNVNRRADGIKGGGNDRRSTGANNRYNNPYGQQQRAGQQHYIPGQNKRPTGQEVQEQFQEWKETAARKENSGKVFENSTFKAQPKVILENANRNNADRSNNQGPVHWRKNVTIHASKNDQKIENDSSQPHGSPAGQAENISRVTVPAGNAWNKGPPISLLGTQPQHQNHVPPSSPLSNVPADPQPNSEAIVASTSNETQIQESRDASVEEPTINEEKENASNDKKDDQKEDKDASNAGTKKFAFNVNAPAFTPRMTQPSSTPTQVVPIPQQPIQNIAPLPMGAVSAGMPMQGTIPPPGVFSPMAGRSVVPQFQGGPQGFSLVQGNYQQYLVQPPVVGQMAIAPQRGGAPPPTQVYAPAPQGNQRRSAGPATGGAVMMQAGTQWQNQMIMQQIPYGYQYIPGGASAPPQTYVDGTQMIPQGQQQIPPQQYQQRFGPPMGYVIPQQSVPQGQQRYSSGQPIHDGSNPPHTPAISSTGPNSQPPTPGPQPTASPAQPQVSQASGGRGSPATVTSAPPQATSQPQQPFVVSGSQPPMVSHQQPIYHSGPNMVMYPTHPQVIMYNTGSMPVPHMQPYGEHHHMEGGMMQQGATQPMVIHDQYGNYVPSGNPGFYQAPPQHPPNQQQQQQPMSRQNSVPQAVYTSQSSPPGMPQPQPVQSNSGPTHPQTSQ